MFKNALAMKMTKHKANTVLFPSLFIMVLHCFNLTLCTICVPSGSISRSRYDWLRVFQQSFEKAWNQDL